MLSGESSTFIIHVTEMLQVCRCDTTNKISQSKDTPHLPTCLHYTINVRPSVPVPPVLIILTLNNCSQTAGPLDLPGLWTLIVCFAL